MRKSGKQERQEAISRILGSTSIDSQDELLQRLLEEGFAMTQATLSRDLREMKIAKTPDSAGRYVYRMPDVLLPQSKRERHGVMTPFARHGLLNIDFSGQLAVIKVPAGYAGGVAHDMDANNIPGVMGTIAGHDTVLIILREHANRNIILHTLKMLFDA